MKKRLFTFLHIFFFLTACILAEFPANAESVDILSSASSDADTAAVIPEDCTYKEGTVLVTMAAPDGAPLTEEGRTSFDSRILVENSYDFGDAGDLAGSTAQKSFLSDKTLYVSEVSSSSYTTEELIDTLKKKAYVVYAEPDYEQYLDSLSNDPYADEQWHLDGGGNFGGKSTGISFSTSRTKTKAGTPVVAVMDTGIDYSHEDLAEHMWVNSDITLPGIHGYNFTDDTPYCMDTNGHGTHCAGTIAAASDNQKGIAGISDARLMALKIFDDDGKTNNSTIFAALNYLVQARSLGVNIVAVNCSWGGGVSSSFMPSLITQLGRSGTLFVFASGNEGIDHSSGAELTCPYDLYRGLDAENRNYIIITGSSDTSDRPSDFSDYGASDVDLFAPGEKIFSTYIDDTYFPGVYEDATETALTSEYISFADAQDMTRLYTDSELGIPSDVSSTISLNASMDYHARDDSACLEWTLDFRDAHPFSQTSYLYLDVTGQNPDTEADYYVSMMLGSTDSDGHFSWEHVTKMSSGKEGTDDNRFYTAPDGSVYFRVIGIGLTGKSNRISRFYIDDIGLSRANPDTSAFGRYDSLNGTSMAAPMVTGAVALLSEIYPGDTAVCRRNRLLSCTRPSAGATGKCKTGGVLDLTNMDSYVPAPAEPTQTPAVSPGSNGNDQKKTAAVKIRKIKIKTAKKKVKAGRRLSLTAVITPSNASSKRLKWTSSKKKWASVSKKGVVTAKKKGRGHTVTITTAATDGSRKKASVKIRIKK